MGFTTDLLTECASSLGTLSSATGGLTSALEHITTVARRIEQRFRELEEKEEHLRRVSEGVISKQQELAQLDVELRDKGTKLKQRDSEVIIKEERWLEAEKRMAENAAKMNSVIQLNVGMQPIQFSSPTPYPSLYHSSLTNTQTLGGQKFATSKATLLEFKGSFFESLITSEHSRSNGESMFFIDRDPKYFPAVLNYMRDGKFRNSDIKAVDTSELADEFKFFNIPFPHNQINANAMYITPTTTTQSTYGSSPMLSTQITHDHSASDALTQATAHGPAQPPAQAPAQSAAQLDALKKKDKKFEGGGTLLAIALREQIIQWIPERRFSLLYKASRDGFGSKDFHSKCDSKGATLTIIQSKEGFLFGGFAPDSVDSSGEFKNYPTAFIFTLTNPHSIPPTKYHLKRGNTAAVRCLANSGAVFGDGDIRIENSADSEASFVYFPASYFDTTNQRKLTFTGTRKFFTKDVEVYLVI